jgi:predicted ester cyclase
MIIQRKENTMSAQENVVLVQSLLDLYNHHQSDPAWLEKSLAFFTADSELLDVPTGRTLPGPEGYKQLVLFFAEAFPESSGEVTNVFATDDQAALEFTGRGTNTGPLHMPTGDIPPTGRYSELRFCGVYRIKSGKIVSLHNYYDVMTLLQNLGLVPAPGQAS